MADCAVLSAVSDRGMWPVSGGGPIEDELVESPSIAAQNV